MNPYDNVLHPNPRGRGSISTRGLQWQTRWTPKRPKLQCGWGILSPKTSRDIEFTYRSSVYIYIQYIIIYNEYDIYIYIYTHVCMYIYIYLHIQYTYATCVYTEYSMAVTCVETSRLIGATVDLWCGTRCASKFRNSSITRKGVRTKSI